MVSSWYLSCKGGENTAFVAVDALGGFTGFPSSSRTSTLGSNAQTLQDWFGELVSSSEFRAAFQQTPIHFINTMPFVRDFFTLGKQVKELAESGLMDRAADCIVQHSSKGTSSWHSERAHIRSFADVKNALKRSTLTCNYAGGSWAELGQLCRNASALFNLPVNINVYMTHGHTRKDLPLHNDNQDVLILQTQGQKRWRVYRPLPASTIPENRHPLSPFNRGKDGDVLTPEQLGPPLLDQWLRAGQALYVPVGFPHSTVMPDSKSKAKTEKVFSNHLTLGIETKILNYWLLHGCLRLRKFSKDGFALDQIPVLARHMRQLNQTEMQLLFHTPSHGFAHEPGSMERVLRQTLSFGDRFGQGASPRDAADAARFDEVIAEVASYFDTYHTQQMAFNRETNSLSVDGPAASMTKQVRRTAEERKQAFNTMTNVFCLAKGSQ